MADCKNCPFYDSEYDSMKNRLEDVIIEGQEHEEHHFCMMHDTNIDDYFIHNKKCEFDQNQQV